MQVSLVSTISLIGIVVLAYLALYSEKPPFDLVNGKKTFEISTLRTKKEFMKNAYKIITDRFESVPGKPFRLTSDFGEVTILPPKYAHEIRNDNRFSFTKATYKWFYAHLPGLQGFSAGSKETQIMKLVARHQLTQQLMRVTKVVSDECVAALQDLYGTSKNWHEINMRQNNLHMMARVTSRIFLGEELCRDPDWLRITSTYSVVAFRAVEELRFWPSLLRPLVQWFLPHCTASRALVEEARKLIGPVLQKRRKAKAEAAERGEKTEFNDAISWIEDLAQEFSAEYDPVCAQLSLSTAALHSTTDFFTQVTLDIAKDPTLIEALRAEITTVLANGTWNKNSLYNLKLMDSVLKESQRLKPIAVASMRRFTVADITLSDGVRIPKNTMTLVSAQRHWDEKYYENANTFDGYRFLRMRQTPGQENRAQVVSATADHMGFGFGLHACPGRFFAAEEIKIALSHMLMNYDFKLVPGCDIEPRRIGFSLMASPTAKLAVRHRQSAYAL
ncbi:GA14-synthase [Pyrenochaeta sp. MPI-SDFR-AT-0127]|nr:GA14-synthase [Pyrenochaeta sp. MPI-SDFR-AT-0127]